MRPRPTIVALIPARAGSKRIPGKNVRRLAGHPLMAYAIAAARESGIFSAVVVCTDSTAYAGIARHYGAEAPFVRPADLSGDLAPDIGWVEHALGWLKGQSRSFDCFSILRPTSPFRRAGTIRRAFDEFLAEPGVDSLRAVERCKQHPGKMWVVRGRRMLPLLPFSPGEQPWHSTPYQALPVVYAQNASLEIAWSRVVFEGRTIAGEVVMPFFTGDNEGFDVNQPADWSRAEHMVADGTVMLPPVAEPPYAGEDAAG